MELKVPSTKIGGLTPGCVSKPEEKEVSDEDDDDRNHKHRRREIHSESLETDSMDLVFTKSYRKHNKFFENGQPLRENEHQAGEAWKNNKNLHLDKDLTSKFDRRHSGLASIPRGHLDVNQRIRSNPPFSGVGLFSGRGLPNVSNAHNPSWSAFDLMPGIPNGGLDTIHPIGLQGVLRPPMNSSLNMGIPRQRCRDFEECGFCPRGDMCPMEHGVNRIVIEDVQFNLPGTIPSAQLLSTPTGSRPLPSSVPPTNLMNNKGMHSKTLKSGITEDASEVSAARSRLHSPKIDESEPLLNDDISDRHNGRLNDTADNELPTRSIGSQGTSLSVWGRIGSARSRIDTKEKIDLTQSDYPENETKEEKEAFPSSKGASCQVKRIITEDDGSEFMDSSFKSQTDNMRNSLKPTQKALRTLFVNGIPLKNNKREALLSHFRKFGGVIDIYIPINSERAFVQFLRREE
ncbi:hypothetical protein V6N13_043393 [Hibiscus sabdariffa]